MYDNQKLESIKENEGSGDRGRLRSIKENEVAKKTKKKRKKSPVDLVDRAIAFKTQKIKNSNRLLDEQYEFKNAVVEEEEIE